MAAADQIHRSPAGGEREGTVVRNRTRLVALSVFLVALHLLLHVGLGLGALAPDLVTLAILIVARTSPLAVAAFAGLVLGLLKDATALSAFGANALAGIVAGILGSLCTRLIVYSRWFFASYLFFGKLAVDTAVWVAGGDNRGSLTEAAVAAGIGGGYLVFVGFFIVILLGLTEERL